METRWADGFAVLSNIFRNRAEQALWLISGRILIVIQIGVRAFVVLFQVFVVSLVG
jgi:hypothetical protein